MKSRLEILTEDMNHKFDLILECLHDVPDTRRRLRTAEDNVAILKDEMAAVKPVIKDHSSILEEDSEMLINHDRLLKAHSRLMDEHGKLLHQSTQQLTEIKTDILKQDRNFDDLKLRQLRVEANMA